MSILMGLHIQGLTLTTEENFNSIPGLRLWLDARERIQISSGVKVAFWGDKSPEINSFTRTNPVRQVDRENDIWVKCATNGNYLSSPRKNYRFLHNGSKFGIYAIQKYTWSLSSPALANGLFFTGGPSNVGLTTTMRTSSLNGAMGVSLRKGDGTGPSKLLTDLLNPASPNYSPSDNIYITSVVNLGQVNGVLLTYGNALSLSAPFYSNLSDYPTGDNTLFNIMYGLPEITNRAGLILIYDWTNYTSSQVIAFDAHVRTMLNSEKAIFENLDI